MSYHETIVFASDIAQVIRYDCAGLDHAPEPMEEEAAVRHEIELPRYGAFVRTDAFGSLFTDRNHVAFFNRDQPFQVSHPIPGGDGGTIISIPDALLLDAIAVYDPTVADRADQPFQESHRLLDANQQLIKYQLLSVLAHLDDYAPLEIEETIILFVNWLFGSGSPRLAESVDAGKREAVHTVLQILNQSYATAPALLDLGQQVHYSPFTLCRIFKQVTGLTIQEYLSRLRLIYALEILSADPACMIGDVALSLGYYSHSHFTAAFSRYFGLPPARFRQMATAHQIRQLRKNLQAELERHSLH